MSLVNEALKKARMEAARGDAAKSGIPYPALGRGQNPPSGPWVPVLVAVLLLAVGLGGIFLFRAGRESALRDGPGQPVAVADARNAVQSGRERDTTVLGSEGLTDDSRPPTESTATGNASPAPAAQPGPRTSPMSVPAPRRDQPASKPESAQAGDSSEPRPAATPKPLRREPREQPPAVVAQSSPPSNAASKPEARSAGESSSRPARGATPAAESAPAPSRRNSGESSDPAVPTPAAEYLRSAEIAGVGAIELGGIAWAGDRPFALVNGRVVRPGDSVSGLLVEEIQPNTVRLRGDGGDFVLKLK